MSDTVWGGLGQIRLIPDAELRAEQRAQEDEHLARRLLVALTEQRVLDTAHFGSAPYAPPTIHDARRYLGISRPPWLGFNDDDTTPEGDPR